MVNGGRGIRTHRIAFGRLMPWQVTLMLADAAQAVGNKLYILGGGWSIIGPDPTPSALALHLKVPWGEANEPHRLRLELLDSDGQAVMVGDDEGQQEPMAIETEFEVGRPPGLVRGAPIDLSLAINLGPLPLAPAGRFEWRLSIDGHQEEGWHAAFTTRPARSGVAGG